MGNAEITDEAINRGGYEVRNYLKVQKSIQAISDSEYEKEYSDDSDSGEEYEEEYD